MYNYNVCVSIKAGRSNYQPRRLWEDEYEESDDKVGEYKEYND